MAIDLSNFKNQKLVFANKLSTITDGNNLETFKNSIVITGDGHLVSRGQIFTSEAVFTKMLEEKGVKFSVADNSLTITDNIGNVATVSLEDLTANGVKEDIAGIDAQLAVINAALGLGNEDGETVDVATAIKNAVDAATAELQAEIATEKAAREAADSALDAKISSNATDIAGLKTNVSNNAAAISANGEKISALEKADTQLSADIATAKSDAIAAAKTETTSQVNSLNSTLSASINAVQGNLNTHAAETATKSTAAHVRIVDAVADAENGQESITAASVSAVKAVQTSIESDYNSKINAVKDSIASGLVYAGTITDTLPSSDLKKGNMYKVASAVTLSVNGVSTKLEAGDMLIYNGEGFDVIQTNIESPAIVDGTLGTGSFLVGSGDNGVKKGEVGKGLTLADGELSVNLGAEKKSGNILGVYEEGGKLVVDATGVDTNTWRNITFVSGGSIETNVSLNQEALKFGSAFKYDQTNGVDLVWFELND
jgi:hypothetical protein